MAMRSASAPRRVYSHKGTLLVMIGGTYFSPGKEATEINVDKEVRTEMLESAGGRKRIQVSQRAGKKTVTETWRQANPKFEPRASA